MAFLASTLLASVTTVAVAHVDTRCSEALYVELGGCAAIPTAPFCKVCTLGGGCEAPGWLGSLRPVMATGYTLYAHAVYYNDTHSMCTLPPVDAAGPVALFSSHDNKTWNFSRPVNFKPLLQASFGRRPYTLEDQSASLLVSVDRWVTNARVRLSIKGQHGDTLVVTATSDITSHSFVIANLPAGIHDTTVTLSGFLPSGESVDVQLPLTLHRAPAPTSTFVQVDYEHRMLRVNRSKPFLLQGYYNNQMNLSDIVVQGKLGYTAAMYYGWMGVSVHHQQRLLDTLAANNMMLLVDLSDLMMDIACGGTAGAANCTKDSAALADAWAAVEGQISRWKSHPGVLGWYVCDDCYSQYLMRQVHAGTPTLDRYYAKIKALDPAHPLVGANNAPISFPFTHATEFAPRPSLDVVMFEDYAETLAACPAVPDGDLCAPTMLWPATFEAQVNSPGPYMVDEDKSLRTEHDRGLVMEGMAWISALARVPQQLHFRRRYVESSEALEALGRFSHSVLALSRFTAPSVVGMYDDTTIVVSTPSVRVGLLVDTSADSLCALVVAVNLNSSSRTSFEATIGVGRRKVGAGLTALRYDQANRSVPVSLRPHSAVFSDVLEESTTGLFVVCANGQLTEV
eukprot:COSAG03_NODE_175_length_11150_cov_7.837691_9_plen_625_part_00